METIKRIKEEVSKVVVGQDKMIEGLLAGLLCRGHILLEGVPGLAKTTTVNALPRRLVLSLNEYSLPQIYFLQILSVRRFMTLLTMHSRSKKDRYLPIFYWQMRSTVRPPKCNLPCWK